MDLTVADEQALLERHLNRVTDTCIPEEEAIRRIEDVVLRAWMEADQSGERLFPHEFLYRILLDGSLAHHYQIDPADSWLLAAAEKNLPIIVPGWEDSTLGNIYAAHCMQGDIANVHTVRSGIEYMMWLAGWYEQNTQNNGIGFFQIGGGIAGCSTLYHLTREGWTDVVLVERNELTSGTTWHSAAQVTNFGMNQTMVGLKTHSINLYKELAEANTAPACEWISFDQNELTATVTVAPTMDDVSLPVDVGKVVAFMQR